MSYKEILMNIYKVKQIKINDPNIHLLQIIRLLSSIMINQLNIINPFSGSIFDISSLLLHKKLQIAVETIPIRNFWFRGMIFENKNTNFILFRATSV